jgi:hypothetical protein
MTTMKPATQRVSASVGRVLDGAAGTLVMASNVN